MCLALFIMTHRYLALFIMTHREHNCLALFAITVVGNRTRGRRNSRIIRRERTTKVGTGKGRTKSCFVVEIGGRIIGMRRRRRKF